MQKLNISQSAKRVNDGEVVYPKEQEHWRRGIKKNADDGDLGSKNVSSEHKVAIALIKH